ncbi:PspA-associated protein PspAB [Brevibacterium litoralis]|uniref:PspA-associated protein PspAB n=1 Tax=Brevibacterium litoralis TaxID=3138935 RepID=UPI0032ED7EFC
MGFLDALFGRSTPKKANLDDLFALPPAVLTVQAATGFTPTGVAAVAFREVEGAAFDSVEAESRALIASDPDTTVRQENDGYGFTWQVITNTAAVTDVPHLVTSMHAVNSSLENQGFGPMLLCSTLYLADPQGRRMALVYLYKRGTFYPFAQTGPHTRDSALEIQMRGVLSTDLDIESDMSRWSPVWDAPGLTD